MSWSRRAGRMGSRSWRWWTLGAMAAGLLAVIVVYASNPDGDVTISPRNDQWETSGVTNVWGLSETIRYRAECNPCTGTHNCQFTTDGGLTLHLESNEDAFDSIYGSKTSTGSYSLAAKCPDDGSHGTPTQTFYVVDTAHLQIDGQNVEGTTQYFDAAETGEVTITAVLTPDVTSGLRNQFMSWSGGDEGADQLHRTVTLTEVGITTITCKAGPNGTELSVTIVVIGDNPDLVNAGSYPVE